MESFDRAAFERDYVRGECLGKGGVGEVYLHQHAHTGELRVVKEVKLDSLVDIKKKYIDRCLLLLPQLHHEHILAFFGCYQPSQMEYRLVFEYMPGGDLGSVIRKGKVGQHMVKKWVRQLLLALNYMHQQDRLHRDVKPVNVLLTSTDLEVADIKLADFDTLREIGASESFLIGTMEYRSPESQNAEYSNKTDVWSVGCLTYRMSTGSFPFNSYDYTSYRNGPNYSRVDTETANFIKRCLKFDPRDRPAVRELLSDPFLNEPFEAQLKTVFVNQVNLSLEQVRLMRELSSLAAKSAADNAYRMALENLELMEDYAMGKEGFQRECEEMRAKAEELRKISEEMYAQSQD